MEHKYRIGDYVTFRKRLITYDVELCVGVITRILKNGVHIEDASNTEYIRTFHEIALVVLPPSLNTRKSPVEPIPQIPEGYIMISENLLKKLIGQELFDEFKACMQYNER